MLFENANTMKESREALLAASREVGLGINTEETKYIIGCVSPLECRTKSQFIDW
jgi:hypothetical protein